MSYIAEFDYVIVGGGSAGCVLADHLSRNPKNTVCLIEAGPSDSDLRIKIPFGLINLMGNPKFDWRLRTTPQKAKNGATASVPRGKTLGGSGSINSMVYIRGRASDYDKWSELGADGWSWNDVLPYFKQQENNQRLGNDELHGASGPLHVQDLPSPHHLLNIWQEAGESLQIPRSSDFNGATQEGLGVYQTTMKNGRRWSAADAFLRPALKRQNLQIFTQTEVDKIHFDEKRATSIAIRRQGQKDSIKIKGELILSAGAIGSPALLLRSGVGPSSEAKQAPANWVSDLAGVGKNLHDHPAIAVFHGQGATGYGLSFRQLPVLASAPFRYLLNRTGLLASNTVEGGGFAKTSPSFDEPNVQFHFIPARLGHQGKMIVWGQGYYSDVCLLKPKSRGEITLSDNDNALNIDLNLLNDEDDRIQLLEGLKLLRRIMAASAFDKVRSKELAPGPEIMSDSDLEAYMAKMMGTAYHPVGTCKMGKASDKMSVVTPDLKVKTLDNVRVVDASIMPEIVAGNTNAPTMMIAEKAAAHILNP